MNQPKIEQAIDEILLAFDVDAPPVPVETMLQRPREGMWSSFDLAEMSASFLSLSDRFAPRMSVVRLLARNIARSQWGVERGLDALADDPDVLRAFARAIIMPQSMLDKLDAVTVATVSNVFEVPESDAEQRLQDLGQE
jgi:hypothetical protein